MEGFSCLEQRLKEEAAVADAGVNAFSCGLACWSNVLQTLLLKSSSEITSLQVAFAAVAWYVPISPHVHPSSAWP